MNSRFSKMLQDQIEDYLSNKDLDFEDLQSNQDVIDQIDCEELAEQIENELQNSVYTFSLTMDHNLKPICDSCYRIYGAWVCENGHKIDQAEIDKNGRKIILMDDFV